MARTVKYMEPIGGYYRQLDIFHLVRMDKFLQRFKLGNIARFDVSDFALAKHRARWFGVWKIVSTLGISMTHGCALTSGSEGM